MKQYIDSTSEDGVKFYQDYLDKGRVVMLNLLRFKEVADYSDVKVPDPGLAVSGKEAYALYMKHTLPLLEHIGSRIVFYGSAGNYLIGPSDEKWDAVLIVEHQSVTEFINFAQNREYLEISGHRKAALQDSRLLPMSELDL